MPAVATAGAGGDGDFVPLADIGTLLPRPVHAGTAARWASTGVGGIVLQTVKIGGRRYTRRRWVEQFLAAVNGVQGRLNLWD